MRTLLPALIALSTIGLSACHPRDSQASPSASGAPTGDTTQATGVSTPHGMSTDSVSAEANTASTAIAAQAASAPGSAASSKH